MMSKCSVLMPFWGLEHIKEFTKLKIVPFLSTSTSSKYVMSTSRPMLYLIQMHI